MFQRCIVWEKLTWIKKISKKNLFPSQPVNKLELLNKKILKFSRQTMSPGNMLQDWILSWMWLRPVFKMFNIIRSVTRLSRFPTYLDKKKKLLP